MLNRQKHQLIMGQILGDLSSNTTLSPILGFKGGTCAYLFYGLPRFSVDLDFDLLDASISPTHVLQKLSGLISPYGEIKDLRVKRYTVFALLSYGEADHNIKIEINIRNVSDTIRTLYEPKQYLGIPLLVGKQDFLFSSKLVALLGRSHTAMRDVFDIHFYAKNTWPINKNYIEEKTGKSVVAYLGSCAEFIEKIPHNAVLTELGELIDDKQKSWVKTNLKKDTIFLLKNYQATLG